MTNELCYSYLTVVFPIPKISPVHHVVKLCSAKINTHPNSDAAAPGEAEVLVALGVPVPDDGLLRVLDQGRGAARVAGARAHLHSKLG